MTTRTANGRSRPLVAALAAVLVATIAGLVLAEVLIRPSSDDMRALAVYLIASGVATVGIGWLVLHTAGTRLRLSTRGNVILGVLIASCVGLINVLVTAQLMFVSTGHDLQLLITLLVFSGIVTMFFSLWIASQVAGRAQRIAAAIRDLAAGDYTTRIEVAGGDELALLAADVNTLATRLRDAASEREQLDRERRELTAAISHDLRTPLASARAMVEALADGIVEEPAEVHRYYETLGREIGRLSGMIDDLFELARLDAGAAPLLLSPVELQEIAAEVVDAMQAQAVRKGIKLTLNVENELSPLTLDGSRMERAIANLVRNAMEHTSSGGSVEVRLGLSDLHAVVTVADTGEGIAAIDLPHVWDRFYRAEKSRKRDGQPVDGAGLGLAIVRGIVEAHGGTVAVTSEPGQGAIFALRIPSSI